MKESINLTIPLDEKSLAETSKMLAYMADYFVVSEPSECDNSCSNCDVTDNSYIEVIKPDVESITAEAFDQTNIATPAPPLSNETEGVELDSDGLPWDVRIHGMNKNKLKKTEQWKKKKGVALELVTTVEAELRAVMNIPKPSSDDTTQISEQSSIPLDDMPVPPETIVMPIKYLVDGTGYTADELKGFNSGWNDENIATLEIVPPITKPSAPVEMTFPDIMAKITAAMTANTITKENVDNACIKHGLASLPLLANRPDLIPAVGAELFA